MPLVLNGDGNITGLSVGGLPTGVVNSTNIVDASITQADLAANVVGNGPAFSAYLSGNQSFSSSTWTKGAFALEEYDTNSNFNTTNYRFLPTVAGYYQISCTGLVTGSASDRYMQLYKNGTGISPSAFYVQFNVSSSNIILSFSNLLYLNGSTDYLELWYYSDGASPSLNSSGTHFQGFLARSA